MGCLGYMWRKLTHTKAIEECGGDLELQFFESVYRVMYLEGLSSSDKRCLYMMYSTSIKFLMMLFFISEVLHLFTVSMSLNELIDNLNVTLIHAIAIYRYKNMMNHKDVFKKLAGATKSPNFDISTNSRRKLMEFWRTRNDRFLKLLLTLGSCTLCAWYVYPLVDELECNLMVAVRLPFDYCSPIRYPITYIIVLIIFHYTSYFVMVNDLIMQAHLMHLLCQYTVLADCFENILPDCKIGFQGVDHNKLIVHEGFRERYVQRLRELVEQHQFILDNTILLRNILSVPMLGQLVASGMLICFVGYQVTANVSVSLTKFLMSLFYLGYNMFELFIFCRWCDEIKIQSENIRDAIYCSGWENGLTTIPGVRLRLLLTMARASRPLVLSAGGLCDLSLSSYTTLIKTSYSALTVLMSHK